MVPWCHGAHEVFKKGCKEAQGTEGQSPNFVWASQFLWGMARHPKGACGVPLKFLLVIVHNLFYYFVLNKMIFACNIKAFTPYNGPPESGPRSKKWKQKNKKNWRRRHDLGSQPRCLQVLIPLSLYFQIKWSIFLQSKWSISLNTEWMLLFSISSFSMLTLFMAGYLIPTCSSFMLYYVDNYLFAFLLVIEMNELKDGGHLLYEKDGNH